MSIIEWHEDGYPTEESLKRLEEALKSVKSADEWKRAVNVFMKQSRRTSTLIIAGLNLLKYAVKPKMFGVTIQADGQVMRILSMC